MRKQRAPPPLRPQAARKSKDSKSKDGTPNKSVTVLPPISKQKQLNDEQPKVPTGWELRVGANKNGPSKQELHLLGQVLSANPESQEEVAKLIKNYTEFLKNASRDERLTLAPLEDELSTRHSQILALQKQVGKLQAAIALCGAPSTGLTQAGVADQFAEKDTRIQELESEVDKLRSQITQGAKQYKQTMACVRQQNADLQSEVLGIKYTADEADREMKRVMAELRRVQTRIARRHPALGLPAAIAAEEAIARQQDSWVSSEEEDEEGQGGQPGTGFSSLASQNPHVRRNSPLRSSFAPSPPKASKSKEKAARQAAAAAAAAVASTAAAAPVCVMSITVYDTKGGASNRREDALSSQVQQSHDGPSQQARSYNRAESEYAGDFEADEAGGDEAAHADDREVIDRLSAARSAGTAYHQEESGEVSAAADGEGWVGSPSSPRTGRGSHDVDDEVQQDAGVASASGAHDGDEALGGAHDAVPGAAEEAGVDEEEGATGEGAGGVGGDDSSGHGKDGAGHDTAGAQQGITPREDEHLQLPQPAHAGANVAEQEGEAEELQEEDGVHAAAEHAQMGESHGDLGGYTDDFESMGISKASQGQLGQFGDNTKITEGE